MYSVRMSSDIGVIEEISRRGAEEVLVEWRIPNFPSLLDGRKYCYVSHVFRIGNGSWCLNIWPNWKREARNPGSGWVRLGLRRRYGGSPATFRFSMGIRGSGGVEKSREELKEFRSYGSSFLWDDFCSRSELLQHRTRLMPNSTLSIRCVLKKPGAVREMDILRRSEQNGLEIGDSEAILKEQGLEELQKSLKSMLTSGKERDVVIKVQGKEFLAHKSILRARSPVFDAMFAHNMVEKQSSVVTLEDCDPEMFPHFLEHIYTGSLKMISIENVFSLFTSSEKYDLPALKKACAVFIKKNLTVATFCDAITLAYKYNDKELMERATEFYCNNTLGIVQTPEWQIFLTENPTIGNDLYIKQLRK